MSNQTATTRKVRVFSTVGQRDQTIETTAQTWGELKKVFDEKGIQYDGMQAVVRETKTILKLDGAVLPKGLTSGDTVTDDIVIFLSPLKQKAGNYSESMTHRDLKRYIQNARSNDSKAVSFFGNYTQKSSKVLQKLVNKWENAGSPSALAQPKTSCKGQDTLSHVFNLLQEAVQLLGTVDGLAARAEYKKLDAELAEVEFELSQN